MDTDNDQGMLDEAPEGDQPREDVVLRDPPKPDKATEQLVKRWNDRVNQAKEVYEDRFREIRKLQRFARGEQWPSGFPGYVTNITLRHLRQQVSRLYAKNPKAVARVRKRREHTVWDGKMSSVKEAQQTLQLAMQAQTAMAAMPNPAVMQAVQAQVVQAQGVLQDYQLVTDLRKQLEGLSETMELLYDYNVDEQTLPFKTMMKACVLRAKTTGVAYVKLGFQRLTQMKPDYESRIHDISARLRQVEQAAADLADNKMDPESADAAELRLQIEALAREGTTLLREGLTFDYPGVTSIIPDLNCKHLKTFMGCRWVAQEYLLPTVEVQRIYGVDVSSQFTTYKGRTSFDALDSSTGRAWAASNGAADPSTAMADPAGALALVREIYCKDTGLVYVVCAGYPDFLQPPGPPDVWTERFWPWFPLVFNEVDDPDDAKHPFPPSDVELIMDAQREINRSREGLREHRKANRPGYATPTGTLSDDDKNKLEDRPAHAIIDLNGLQPGQKVSDVLQGLPSVPIDPNLYETNSHFEDILRAGGLQEANLGPTSGATATESSIAQASLSATSNSDVDELDDFLTQLARTGGQILLLNVSEQTAKQLVGPGAIWPTMTRDEVARDLYLEIEAGSTGRPNQAQEIANAERLVPLLIQIPDVNPTALARELIRRLDDRLNIDNLISEGMPSIVSLNQASQPATGDPATDPAMQGPAGGAKAQPGASAPDAPQGVDTTSETPSPGADNLPA